LRKPAVDSAPKVTEAPAEKEPEPKPEPKPESKGQESQKRDEEPALDSIKEETTKDDPFGLIGEDAKKIVEKVEVASVEETPEIHRNPTEVNLE